MAVARTYHLTLVYAAQVYAGAVAALALMTVLSAVMGWAAPNLVCRRVCS